MSKRSWAFLSALLLILGASSPADACEPPELTWAKRAGGGGFDSAQSVARAGDGWVVCGSYSGVATFDAGEPSQVQLVSTGSGDGFLACYAPDGSLRWARTTQGAPGHSAEALDVAANSSGQIFVTGTFSGSVTFGGITLDSQGPNDSFVASYDANGTLLWARHVTGPGGESASSVCALGSSSIAVAGRFDQTATVHGSTSTWSIASAGQYDAFYAVYSADGALSFAGGEGGTGDEGADEVAASPDGSAFSIAGQMIGETTFGLGHGTTTTFNSSVTSAFVSSYTPSGTLRWVKRVVHSNGGSFSRGLASLADGSVVAAGQVAGSATFGSGETNQTTLVASLFAPNVFLARYGPDGQLAWARRDGGGSFAYGWSVSATAGDDLLVAGGFEGSPAFGEGETEAATLTSNGGRDGFIARYSAAGRFLWAQRAGGSQYDEARGVAATSTGEAVLLGTFNSSILFDSEGQPGATGLTSAGGSDVFLGLYTADSTGFLWARGGVPTTASAFGVAAYADGSSVVTGNFADTAVFGAGEAAETPLTSPHGWSAFIARYRADGTLVWARGATTASISGQVGGVGVATHADGSATVTGWFQESAVLGGGQDEPQVFLEAPWDGDEFTGHGVFVARYAADGTLLWARAATGNGVLMSGGTFGAIGGYADGSSVVTGAYFGTANFGGGVPPLEGGGVFVARYAPDGTPLWARARPGPNGRLSGIYTWGSGVASHPDGSCDVTGWHSGSMFLTRYAADGTPQWERSVVGAYPRGAAGCLDGSSVLTGSLVGGPVVFGAGEPAQTTFANHGAFVARYKADGSLMWARATVNASGESVAVYPDGSSVVTGSFGHAVFGAGEATETILYAGGLVDAFIARYAADGAFLGAAATSGAWVATGRGVAAHADGSAVIVGTFWAYSPGTLVFGSGEGATLSIGPFPYQGAFVAGYAGPASVTGPEIVVAECAGDGATEVTFDLLVMCGDDAVLTVRDTPHGRTLFSGPVVAGTHTMGPYVFPDGLSVVEARVEQCNGHASHSLTVQVADTTAPVLGGCQPTTLELQGPLTTLFRSMLGITVTDACDPSPTVTFAPAAVPLGTTDVLVTAEDATGNNSTATIPVTIVDTTMPIFVVAPADIDRECVGGSVIVNFDVLAEDLSGMATVACTDETGRAVDPAGTTFEDGVHTVTCVATDGSGNSATWSFTISVSDNTAPAIAVPDDITVTNEPGEGFAFVSFSVAATDNCDPSVPLVCAAPFGEVQSGDAFPVGLTVVTCTASDLAGNQASTTFQILVLDTEPPVLTCPAAVELHTDAAGSPLAVTPQDVGAVVTDNWDPAPTVSCEPSLLGVGTSNVTVTARDADGNESMCTVDVTVLLAGQETTQAGTDVVVAPEAQLPDGSTATVTIEFSQVGSGGVTTVTTSDSGQPLPDGFKLGDEAIYYDVSTTAQFSGTIELCFRWQEGQFANEADARLFHYENGAWTDVTTSVDTATNIICGTVTSLSPFAIVEPSYAFGGIRQPIEADGSSVFKRGRVVPVKFELRDPDGTYAADATVRLRIVKVSNSVLGTVEEEIDPATVGSASTGNLFRYDAAGHQFIYNLATSGLTAGTYRLEILPDDGSRHAVRISVRD